MRDHADHKRIPAQDAGTEQADAAPAAVGLQPAPVTRLVVGAADDAAEVAAEAHATSVLGRLRRYSGGASGASTSGSSATAVGRSGGGIDANRSADIAGRIGAGGAPLPDGVRSRMESGFGTSLSHVRVHQGADVARQTAALGTDAFTVGSDIFFAAGRLDGDAHGEHVLAHELAHVVAESGSTGSAAPVRRNPGTRPIAEKIGKGHAFSKHVQQQAEYGNITQDAFIKIIEDTMDNGVSKGLAGGRTAYWLDGTIVIHDPSSGDRGTAFKPTDGKAYYDRQI